MLIINKNYIDPDKEQAQQFLNDIYEASKRIYAKTLGSEISPYIIVNSNVANTFKDIC